MKLSKTDIAGLIPHAGDMCLLDGVDTWDEGAMVCTATGHGHPAHPLRDGATLPAVCGIEYAAQAVALHAALSRGRGQVPAAGLLAAVRDVILSVDRLDDLAGPLTIRVEKLLAQDAGLLYRFAVAAGGREALQGRLSVCWLRDAGRWGRPAGT
jgi:predicted hotdog family 3-hydroxylacyl-ACP dehydratase